MGTVLFFSIVGDSSGWGDTEAAPSCEQAYQQIWGAVKHVGLLVHLFLTRMLDICQSSSVVQKSCSVNGILT